MVKVYTRGGDGGTTSLLSGGRVHKDHVRVEAYGTLDELNAVLGLMHSEPLADDVRGQLRQIQETLFAIGSALADPEQRMDHDAGVWAAGVLETWIDAADEELEPLEAFILPGGSRGAGLAHVARTVCRRGERRVLALAATGEPVPDGVLPFVNRLSDYLFTLARLLNARLGVEDPKWSPRRGRRGDGGS
jgi:cob(I)alamin adenosyltransferase